MTISTYPDPSYMHLPGDAAVCGCRIEWETGAFVPCYPAERVA